MRPQGELGPCPRLRETRRQCWAAALLRVPSGTWLDAQRAAATVSPRVDLIPGLWFKAPPRSFISDGKEGRLPVSTALVPEACAQGPGG